MRPYGYASRNLGADGAEPRHELQDIPQAEKNDRRDGDRKNNDKRKNASPGIEQNIGSHDSGDSSAGAEGRNCGMQIKGDVEQAGADPADGVKKEIGEVPEEVFDIVSEDPEKKHVSGDVPELGMQKHAGEQGEKCHFESHMACKERGDARRDSGIGQHKRFEGGARESELIQKDNHVYKDQRNVHERISAGGIEVLERDEHEKWPGAE